MGAVGVRRIPQSLVSGLGQAIVAGPTGILLAGEIQQDVIHGRFHLGIICQGLKAETRCIPIGKFLPDCLEIMLDNGKRLLFTAGVGHLAHRTVFLNLLLP